METTPTMVSGVDDGVEDQPDLDGVGSKRFQGATAKVMPIIETDIGRSNELAQIKKGSQWNNKKKKA